MSTPSRPSNKLSSPLETTTARIPNSKSSLKQYHTKTRTTFLSPKSASCYNSRQPVYPAATRRWLVIIARSLERSNVENESYRLTPEFRQKLSIIGNCDTMRNLLIGTEELWRRRRIGG